jgi:hypothetical protein
MVRRAALSGWSGLLVSNTANHEQPLRTTGNETMDPSVGTKRPTARQSMKFALWLPMVIRGSPG